VAGDFPFRSTAVGPLDGVDPERQVATAMDDSRLDDPLDEVVGFGS
jgi:hypothetical protein